MGMTPSQIQDLGSYFAGAATEGASYWETGNEEYITRNIPEAYTGYDYRNKEYHAHSLAIGWGPVINNAGEKKLFRWVGVRRPRAKLNTVGDVLDYLFYYGKTGLELWENKDSPQAAVHQAVKTQYGIDRTKTGWAVYNPIDMLMEKVIPYILQKKVRKFLNLKMPKFGGS